MTEIEHAQWIRQFWKDKLDEMKGDDKQNLCDDCYYAEGSPYCLKYCQHDAEKKEARNEKENL